MDNKILVIDDESEIVDLILTRLEANGYKVIAAFDGLEGLNLARQENPSLIILDVMMPKVDGFHVCKMIKIDENLKDVPIILLSARGEKADKKLGLEVKADSYIVKPFESQQLLSEVKRLLKD